MLLTDSKNSQMSSSAVQSSVKHSSLYPLRNFYTTSTSRPRRVMYALNAQINSGCDSDQSTDHPPVNHYLILTTTAPLISPNPHSLRLGNSAGTPSFATFACKNQRLRLIGHCSLHAVTTSTQAHMHFTATTLLRRHTVTDPVLTHSSTSLLGAFHFSLSLKPQTSKYLYKT